MGTLRTLSGTFEEEDIFNMYKADLFRRMTPSEDLDTQSRPALKKDKTRVTLALCANATGTERFPVWFIGHAETFRALKKSISASFGAIWKHDTAAWMTNIIMRDWLNAFYMYIGTS